MESRFFYGEVRKRLSVPIREKFVGPYLSVHDYLIFH